MPEAPGKEHGWMLIWRSLPAAGVREDRAPPQRQSIDAVPRKRQGTPGHYAPTSCSESAPGAGPIPIPPVSASTGLRTAAPPRWSTWV